MSLIEHNHLDQFDIDQYMLGKLAAEQSAVLEEHLVDCPQCIQQVKTTKEFLQAFQLVTAEDAAKTADNSRIELRWYSWPMPSHKALAVACLGILAAMVGAILAINQIQRLRVEVRQAQSVSAEWERRFEEEQQSASLSQKERDDMERELRQMEADRRIEQDQRAATTGGPAAGMRPGMNVPLFVLNSVRRSEQASDKTVNEVTLPKSPTAFVLSLALESDLEYEDYRVEISDDNGRRIWSRRGFKPGRYASITVAFNSSSFRPGDYLLTVGGVAKKGGLTPLGNYPIRIIKKS